MSETRPPITAGPIERAFRFLKSTSVSCGVPEEGTGVTDADKAGVVLAGDADDARLAVTRRAVILPGRGKLYKIKRAEMRATRVVIGWRRNHGDLRLKGKRIDSPCSGDLRSSTCISAADTAATVAFAGVKMQVSSPHL